MVAQLQDVVDALTGFTLNQRQLVQQCWGGHQGFFANDVTTQAQTRGNVGVVQVVGAADRHVVQLGGRGAFALVRVFLESLKFREKFGVRRNAVDDADGVVDVVGHGKLVARVLDGAHVAWCYVAAGADECEVFHVSVAHQMR